MLQIPWNHKTQSKNGPTSIIKTLRNPSTRGLSIPSSACCGIELWTQHVPLASLKQYPKDHKHNTNKEPLRARQLKQTTCSLPPRLSKENQETAALLDAAIQGTTHQAPPSRKEITSEMNDFGPNHHRVECWLQKKPWGEHQTCGIPWIFHLGHWKLLRAHPRVTFLDHLPWTCPRWGDDFQGNERAGKFLKYSHQLVCPALQLRCHRKGAWECEAIGCHRLTSNILYCCEDTICCCILVHRVAIRQHLCKLTTRSQTTFIMYNIFLWLRQHIIVTMAAFVTWLCKLSQYSPSSRLNSVHIHAKWRRVITDSEA